MRADASMSVRGSLLQLMEREGQLQTQYVHHDTSHRLHECVKVGTRFGQVQQYLTKLRRQN